MRYIASYSGEERKYAEAGIFVSLSLVGFEVSELYPWRQLLGRIISDVQERQRIARAMGINAVTLTRWARGKTSPQHRHLRSLLDAVAQQYRPQLTGLILEEFPDFFTEDEQEDDISREIPSALYDRVLKARMFSPAKLRVWSISNLILQQMLKHFDPYNRGLAITVAQCMPPCQNGKIRSLREVIGRGTATWRTYVENQMMFLGLESPAGYAVTQGRMVVVQTAQERDRRFLDDPEGIESEICYPILFENRIAGCLRIMSTQANYLSRAYHEIVMSYAALMALVFEPHEFYEHKSIELGLIPKRSIQRPYITQVQKRINQLMLQRKQTISRSEAEQIVWRQVESELLSLSLSP